MVNWRQAAQEGAKEAAAKQMAWDSFLKSFPKAEKSRFITQVYLHKKTGPNSRGVFQSKQRLITKRLRFGQKILERGNETNSRFGRRQRFSLPAVAA